MQRAAAKQLTRLAACPFHRRHTLFINSTEQSHSLCHHQLLHFHRLHQSLQKLAIAHRNIAHANDDCVLKEPVDHLTSQSSSVGAHSNQEEKPDSKGEGQAASSLSLFPRTKSPVVATHLVSHRLHTDPHCVKLSKDSKDEELVPSSEVTIQLQGDQLKDGAVQEGLLSLESGVRLDLSKASSSSDSICRATMDGGGKDSDVTVLDCQSSFEKATRTDSSEACINQSFERKFDNSSDLSVDPLSVSCLLDELGWVPDTERILEKFIGSITPEFAASVVDLQKDMKVAFSFLEWASNREKFEHREETFSKVVGRLGRVPDFELAWKVLEFMKKHGLKVDYAFGIFLHRLRSADMADGVVKAMESMASLDVIPTVPLFTVALLLILKANKLEEAHRLYKQMRQANLQADTKLFNILISGFGRAGQVDDAVSFFKEMQRDEVTPDSFTYTSVIEAFAAAGLFSEGQKFYSEMVQNKCSPKVLSRPVLECALYEVSSMAEIHRIFDDLETGGHTISVYTYNNILQYLVDNKRFLEAVEVFLRLSGETQKCDGPQNLDKGKARCNIYSYSVLITGLCQGGRLTEALLLFKEMMVNGVTPNSEICNGLLLRLSSNESFMFEAVELSGHIVKAKLIVDLETQRTFFRALHDGGNVSQALKIFDSMKWGGCIDTALNFYELIGVAG